MLLRGQAARVEQLESELGAERRLRARERERSRALFEAELEEARRLHARELKATREAATRSTTAAYLSRAGVVPSPAVLGQLLGTGVGP